MAFRRYDSLTGDSTGSLITVVIDNSDAINVGDAVKIRNGNVEIGVAGQSVAGVVVDIVDKFGNSLTPAKGSIAVIGSATRASDGTITVASDNETVDLIAAKIDVSKSTRYSASITGTMGTTGTPTSNEPGGWFDSISTSDGIEETTHTRTIGSGLTWKGWGVDPNDTARVIVSICESEIFDPSTGAALT